MRLKPGLLSLSIAAIVGNATAMPIGSVLPSDPVLPQQWAFGQTNGVDLNMAAAWQMIDVNAQQTPSEAVTVALIGFGVDTDGDQTDFQNGQLITGVASQDQVNNDSNPEENLAWHETMAAGAIAADTNDNGVAGMGRHVDASNKIKVLPIKVKDIDDEVINLLTTILPYRKDVVLFKNNDFGFAGGNGIILKNSFAGCENITELEQDSQLSYNLLKQYIINNARDPIVGAAQLLAVKIGYDQTGDLFTLQKLVTDACALKTQENWLYAIGASPNDFDKFLKYAAIAWVFGHIDYTRIDASIAALVPENVRNLDFSAVARGEKIPDLEQALSFLKTANRGLWVVFDAYWQQHNSQSLYNSEVLANRYSNAIRLAADNAKIINIAQGISAERLDEVLADGQTVRQRLNEAMVYAREKGALVVTSAGNNCSTNITDYPASLGNDAAFPNLITVASLNEAGELAVDTSSFRALSDNHYDAASVTCKNSARGNHTNFGSLAHIAAPGANIVSTAPVQTFLNGAGTLGHISPLKSGSNYATAYVSGALALGMAAKPGLSSDTYRAALMAGVTKTAQLDNWLISVTGGDFPLVRSGGYLNVAGMLEQLGFTRAGGIPDSVHPTAAFSVIKNSQAVDVYRGKSASINYSSDQRSVSLQAIKPYAASTEVSRYVWNFGDGTQQEVKASDTDLYAPITRAYARTGTYNVTLTAYTGDGYADVSLGQKVMMNPPTTAPFLNWSTYTFGGFSFCHAPTFDLQDTYEGVIYQDPGCSQKYSFLDANQEGLVVQGNAIASCGKIDDPKLGMLSYGVEFYSLHNGFWQHNLKISDASGKVLRERYFRELNCSLANSNDHKKIYSLKDVLYFYNPRIPLL